MTRIHFGTNNYTPNISFTSSQKPSKNLKIIAKPLSIDLTNVYSQKEIREILKEVGTVREMPTSFPMRYSMVYLPNFEDIVIDNHSMTNDTTVIMGDGSVRHCGSWHDKEIAPEGSYTNVVEAVKQRLEAKN